ncbi:MAG: ABC transporter substrate-binding protein, partial [Desulfobacteraceae bacterium]|nr:ABC transporter substrate-binding protein [Desulfobacteraceae bacterium]
MKIKTIVILLLGLLLMGSSNVFAAGKDELKIAMWEDVSTFDPGWMTSAERELVIMSCLYNGLVKYKEGSWEVVPDLAESWEVSQDG